MPTNPHFFDDGGPHGCAGGRARLRWRRLCAPALALMLLAAACSSDDDDADDSASEATATTINAGDEVGVNDADSSDSSTATTAHDTDRARAGGHANHAFAETDDEYAVRQQELVDAAADAQDDLADDPDIVAAEDELGVSLVPTVPVQASPQGGLAEVTPETLDANERYVEQTEAIDQTSGYQPGATPAARLEQARATPATTTVSPAAPPEPTTTTTDASPATQPAPPTTTAADAVPTTTTATPATSTTAPPASASGDRYPVYSPERAVYLEAAGEWVAPPGSVVVTDSRFNADGYTGVPRAGVPTSKRFPQGVPVAPNSPNRMDFNFGERQAMRAAFWNSRPKVRPQYNPATGRIEKTSRERYEPMYQRFQFNWDYNRASDHSAQGDINELGVEWLMDWFLWSCRDIVPGVIDAAQDTGDVRMRVLHAFWDAWHTNIPLGSKTNFPGDELHPIQRAVVAAVAICGDAEPLLAMDYWHASGSPVNEQRAWTAANPGRHLG